MNAFLHGSEVQEVNNGTRSIRTPNSRHQAFIGTAPGSSDEDFPMHQPVLVDKASIAANLDPSGTLADCYKASTNQGAGAAIMIRVPDDADLATQLTHVIGDPAAQTGVYALRTVNSRLGLTPRLISAPGFTGARLNGNANPVGAALKALTDADRAIAFVDGPDTTEADALAARNDYGSQRVYMTDPKVLVFENGVAVQKPSSAYASAATSANDLDPSKGFWWSPSNSPLNGVIGTNRPISFGLSNRETEANRLNENGVATVIHRNGYRLWGNRSGATAPRRLIRTGRFCQCAARRIKSTTRLRMRSSMRWTVQSRSRRSPIFGTRSKHICATCRPSARSWAARLHRSGVEFGDVAEGGQALHRL